MVSVASNEVLVEEEISRDAKLLAASGKEMLNGRGAVCMQEKVTQRQVEVSAADVTKSAVTLMTALPATTECSMCTNVAELCENESLKEILNDRQPIPIDCIPKYLRSLCVKCVFKITAHKELTTQMSISRRLPSSINNIHTNHEVSELTTTAAAMMTVSSLNSSQDQQVREQNILNLVPPTPDTSPNNFIAGTASTPMLNVNTPLATPTLESLWHPPTKMNCTQDSCPPVSLTVNTSEITTSVASTTLHSQADQPTLDASPSQNLSPPNVGTPKSSSMSPNHQVNSNYSMLEVYHECVVSPLTTESGGTKNKRDYARVNRNLNPLVCPHCSRSYWRKDYHAKHVRRCNIQKYSRSVCCNRSSNSRNRHMKMESPTLTIATESGLETVNLNNNNNNNNNISSKRNGNMQSGSGRSNSQEKKRNNIMSSSSSSSSPSTRTFVCPTCSLTLSSYSSLKEHRLIHLPRLFCDICGKVYSCLNEFEFHSAICTAKHDMERIASVMRQHEKDGITIPPSARVTRSQSRAATSLAPTSISAISKEVTTRTRTNRRKATTVFNTTAPKRRRAVTNTSNNNRRKAPSRAAVSNDGAWREDSDFEDDSVSVADTMYSKRLRSCSRWVDEHISANSIRPFFEGYELREHNELNFQILTDKEYDLYLLDLLRTEVKHNAFDCYVTECEFRSDELADIMVHDYLEHFNGWFNCRKCNGSFTKKLYLDYHQHEQDPGLHICYICNEVIRYRFAFKKHLIQHQRCINYRCNYCNTEYLDEAKLIWHCAVLQHDPNASPKPRICIDRSMTISNNVELEPTLTRRNVKYEIRILDIKTPPLPSKRCVPMEKYYMTLPNHVTRIAHCIGIIMFKDQRVPNCAMPT